MPSPEIEAWLQRARDTGTPIDMSVSCPKCWLPVMLGGSGEAGDGGCQCGTVVTATELQQAFGVEGLSGSFHGIVTRD